MKRNYEHERIEQKLTYWRTWHPSDTDTITQLERQLLAPVKKGQKPAPAEQTEIPQDHYKRYKGAKRT